MIAIVRTETPASSSASKDLMRVSDRLAALQNKLFEHYGIETIYIGAGSALAVLDHCLHGKALVMRDLDIFACLGNEMTQLTALEMGERLETSAIGRFSKHDVRPRRRGNPSLKGTAAYDYNTGFGFFMIDDADAILDLTVFHSHADMLLNGIMNVDKVRIRLDFGTSLVEQFAPLSESMTQALSELGVEDTFGGYASWQMGTAELVNEFDVRRAPLQTILRIIRTFAKFSIPSISSNTKNQLTRLLAEDGDDSSAFYTIRGLIKVLNDRNAIWELCLLRDLGGLRKIGGVARQHLDRLFQVADRFGATSQRVTDMIKSIAGCLSDVEHEMKLKGVC